MNYTPKGVVVVTVVVTIVEIPQEEVICGLEFDKYFD